MIANVDGLLQRMGIPELHQGTIAISIINPGNNVSCLANAVFGPFESGFMGKFDFLPYSPTAIRSTMLVVTMIAGVIAGNDIRA